ncbi:MAG TPA: aldehyde dehydrogenase family protein [Porticoccaceae bacterium]|nr:aldehyde dehydrogenase family protein [Porticoccaceae bacterium]
MGVSELEPAVKSEIDCTFAEQRRYAIHLRGSDYRQRLQVLDRFERVFKASYEKLYRAAAADFSKPETEVDVTEILPILSELELVRKRLKRWMKPKSVLPALMVMGTSSKILYEPRGVCLVVSPWNYPFNLTFCPMILAVAAGNTVVIKPSEMTPNMSAVIEEIIKGTFEQKEVAVFQGDSATAGYLTSLPFDHIFFTGSPEVGRHVMAAAAKNLASVTLELGGKSPVIVERSANIEKSADTIVFGKFSNNGQTCIAPDYLYVESSIKEEFVAALKRSILRLYGTTEQLAANPDYCRVVNSRHFIRLQRLLDNAIENGAEVVHGGLHISESRLIEPTLLMGVSDELDIMQEEIFGPLLPLIEYHDLDQVIDDINARPKPLALYVFTAKRAVSEKIIRQTSAGDTCVNQIALHYMHPHLPFGGVNNSGLGKTGGRWGFEAFSHQRSVLEDKFSGTALLYPPYAPRVKGLIKKAMRYLF